MNISKKMAGQSSALKKAQKGNEKENSLWMAKKS
jgi:hypothetical protein